MSFGEKEGPTEMVIPEQKFYSCFTCKNYSHKMIKSGMFPIYETTCSILDWNGDVIKDDPNTFIINHYQLNDGKTPDCCPFIKSINRDDKLKELGI